ncbi:MAG: beta strand repeat-containing protein, partial [Flavobacteriales bacterium]
RNSTSASTASFTGIEFNNTAGVDLSAIGSISASVGTALTAGTVLLGINADFTYTATSPTNTRTAGYFIVQGTGKVIKAYTTGASSFTYHIGENTGTTQYSPILLTFSSNSVARNVGVSLVDGDHPQNNNPVVPTDYLSRYWTLSENAAGGTYSFTAQMTYIPTAEDVNGTEASIRAASYGTSWTDVHSSIASPNLTTTAITSGINGLALTGRTAPVSYTWVGFTDGTWGTSTNWSPTGVPSSFDFVTLTNGSTGAAANLNLNSAVTVATITFNGTGSFFTVGASGAITVTGAVTYTAGSGSWNATSTFTMSSSSSQSIPPFNYGNLNTTGGNRVWMAGTTGIAGTFTQGAGTYTPTVGSTVDYNGAGAQTIRNVAYYDLTNSSNTARTLANGTITIANSYTPTTNTITVGTSVVDFSSSGSQNIPASSYNSITNTGNGNRVWASSGNINIAGSFTPGSGTHTVTGSTMRFTNTAAGPTTIPVVTTTTAGISYNNVEISGTNATPSVHSIYGTTVGIGGSLTLTAGTLRLATASSVGTLNVYGTLTMNGGTLSLTNSGTLADAGTLNLYGDLTMSSGTISRTSGVANATINFVNATSPQNWTYSGGSFSIGSGFGIPVNVGNGSTTNTLQLASNVTASSITVNVLSGSTINFGTNTFTSTGSMSFAANSGSNVITANTGGLASSGASGSVQSTGSRTFNTGANYTFNGAAAQITGTGFTGANNLTINNSAGVTLTASASISGLTTLTSGVLALGSNNLTITNTAAGAFSGAGASNFIQTGGTGELRRSIPASIGSSTTYDFPVGTSTNYTPASFTFTATGNAFTLHTRAVAGTHPSMNSNGTQTDYFANRYWVTNTSGTPSTYTYSSQFTQISGDAQGTVANIKLNKWSGAWTEDSGSSATSTVLSSGSLSETTFSLSATAEWVGRANPTSVTYTWSGGTSTDWGTAGNWSPNGVPTAIDNVIINAPGTSFDLSINSSRTVNNFEISGTGNLSMTAAGSLTISGTVTTSGTPSGTFDCASTVTISNGSSQPIPPLNYGNLNASGGNRTLPASGTARVCGTFTPGSGTYTVGGGTFEYNGTGAQTIAASNYNNLTLSGNRGGATVT